MIKKKNYKQQSQFSQLHTFSVYAPPTANQGPRKYQVYYKRYKKQQQSQNLYNLVHSQSHQNQGNQQQQGLASKRFSEDRTLQLISFDGQLGFLKKYLRKIGKIRFYQTGQGIYKGKKINTAMCTFKFQFDLVKCFRQDYLQVKIDEVCLQNVHQLTEQDREIERHDLISKHLDKQLSDKLSKLKDMQKDGFQVVTDIYGQYRMDYDANAKFVQNLPQIKKKKKQQQKQRKLREQLANQNQSKMDKQAHKF